MKMKSFLTNKLSLKNTYFIWLLCFIGFLLVIYFAYIVKGGFIVDDWGVAVNRDLNFGDNFLSWFPLLSNRPLAPLLLTILTVLFRTSPTGYIIANVGFWALAVILIGYVLKRHFGYKFLTFFSVLAVLPIIATSFFFSPGMQIMNSCSVFLWALSFFALDRYLISRKKVFYVLTYVLILCSLLVYEVTLPLLVITAFYPFYCNNSSLKRSKQYLVRYFLKYILSVALVAGAVFVYQKVLIPKFMIVHSRLPDAPLSYFLGEGMQIGWEWLLNMLIGIPVLLYTSLRSKVSPFSYPEVIITLASLVALGVAFIKRRSLFDRFKSKSLKGKPIWLTVILIVSFLAAAMLFVLSTNHPELNGYGNRAFSTSWLLLCVLVGVVAYYSRTVGLVILTVFSLVVLNTFLIERNNYIDSYALQLKVADECIAGLQQQNAAAGATVVGYVPTFLPSNLNDENVFSEPWDFGNVLQIRSNHLVDLGTVFTAAKKVVITGDQVDMGGGWIAYLDQNLWYCEYRQDNNTSQVQKIDSATQFQAIIDQAKADPAGNYPRALFPAKIVRGVISGLLSKNRSSTLANLRDLKAYFINLNSN